MFNSRKCFALLGYLWFGLCGASEQNAADEFQQDAGTLRATPKSIPRHRGNRGRHAAMRREFLKRLNTPEFSKNLVPQSSSSSSGDSFVQASRPNPFIPKAEIILKLDGREISTQACEIKNLENGETKVRLNFEFEGHQIELDLNEGEKFKRVFFFDFAQGPGRGHIIQSIRSLNLVYKGSPELPESDDILKLFYNQTTKPDGIDKLKKVLSRDGLPEKIFSSLGIYKSKPETIHQDEVPCFVTNPADPEQPNKTTKPNRYIIDSYLISETLKPHEELFMLLRLVILKRYLKNELVFGNGSFNLPDIVSKVYLNIQQGSENIKYIRGQIEQYQALIDFERDLHQIASEMEEVLPEEHKKRAEGFKGIRLAHLLDRPITYGLLQTSIDWREIDFSITRLKNELHMLLRKLFESGEL